MAERAKIAATTQKKAAVSKKAKVLVEKRLADMTVKIGETELKLAEAVSLNSSQVEELANLRAALEGCDSKWYNEGFADAENYVEPVINEAQKLAFKEGWFAALQAVGVPEDSPLKDPDHIPFPSLLMATQKTLVIADEEKTSSLRELVEQIDAHAKSIDLVLVTQIRPLNLMGMFSRKLKVIILWRTPRRSNWWTLSFDSQV